MRRHYRTDNWEQARDLARKLDAILPKPASRDLEADVPDPSGDDWLRLLVREIALLRFEISALRKEIAASRE